MLEPPPPPPGYAIAAQSFTKYHIYANVFSFVSTFVFVMYLGAPPLLAIELLCVSYAIALQKCYNESYDAIISRD